jgi:NAD(P)-dependent dehydrogenase (short-subunit alcohol dehydrogenase family)
MRSLQGKKILITGASGGLGERFARVCAAQGAHVALGARRTDRLKSVVADINAEGGTGIALELDVTSERSIISAFDDVERELGGLDGVVVNAGIEAAAAATELSIDDFDRVFAVNVRGAFLTAREAARRMQASGAAANGRIVFISSITANMTTPGIIAYSTSKAAVSHMSRSLAREWSRTGPNVNSLSPGYAASDMTNDWFDTEAGQRHLKSFPRRRLLDPDGLDAALLYLLSDGAKNTTGANLVVDDGQSL